MVRREVGVLYEHVASSSTNLTRASDLSRGLLEAASMPTAPARQPLLKRTHVA